MKVRQANPEDRDQLVTLIAEYRVTLSQFRGRPQQADRERAEEEHASYQDPKYRIFLAEDPREYLVGYLVCRVEERTVFAEALFVPASHRRLGVASELYNEAERLVREVGGDTVYNWVDPNNDRIISFLRNRNYTVLNLIEVRRTRPREKPVHRIKVGNNSFDY